MQMSNPIFTREFLSIARSWKIRLVLTLYLGILGGLLLILWPDGGVQSVVTEGAKKIFSLFFSVNLALLLLIIPSICSSSITLERENGTYPALFSTLLSPFEILWGKLSASALIIVIMVLLSLPVAAICALAGGVDSVFMLRIVGLLLATALSYGIMGLACSSICRRTTGAVLLCYVLVLLFAGATWLPSVLLTTMLPSMTGLFQHLRSVSPFDALLFLLYPDVYKMTLVTEEASWFTPYSFFMVASLVISVVGLIIFRWNIMRPELHARKQHGDVYSDTRKALKRKLTFPFYLFDPLKRKKPIGRFRNPVYVAEMRSRLFANTNFVIRSVSFIFIITLGLLILLAFQMGNELYISSVRLGAIVFQIGIVALLAPGVSSGLITDEITGGTFNALRMTPLSPVTLIFGKLKATFFYALIFLISSVFILLALAYMEPTSCFPEGSITEGAFYADLWQKIRTDPAWVDSFLKTYRTIGIWVAILLVSTMTFLISGLFCSAFSRNTFQATIGAYSITGILCLVTLLPVILGEKFSYDMSYVMLMFNPLAAALQIMSDSFKEYPALWMRNLITLVTLSVVLLCASVGRVYYLFRRQH